MNALLGTVNAILSVYEGRLTAQDVRRVVACMGAEEAAYRVALYPGYHAQRDPMPVELRWQWDQAQSLLEAFGWVFATSADLEADDVMFSYARAEQGHGGSALIVSGDRDMFAAVDERVSIVELGKAGKMGLIETQQVRERYGVDPQQVTDFIALRGDPSDGLPGAPGIGAKTAAELLNAHGTLEAVLAAAREVSAEAGKAPFRTPATTMRPRTASSLRDNETLILKFKEIAELQYTDTESVADMATDYAGGARAAARLGMGRLASRLDAGGPNQGPASASSAPRNRQ